MSQISGEPNAGMQQIDLMKLNLPQLTQLKQQLENVSEKIRKKKSMHVENLCIF